MVKTTEVEKKQRMKIVNAYKQGDLFFIIV